MPNIFVTSFLHRQSAASAALYWYSATIRQQLSPYFEGIFLLFCAIKSQEKNFALTVTSTTSQSFPQTVLQQGFEGKTFSTGRNEFRNLKLTDNAFDALGLPAELRGGFVELLVSQSMCMNWSMCFHFSYFGCKKSRLEAVVISHFLCLFCKMVNIDLDSKSGLPVPILRVECHNFYAGTCSHKV